MKKKTSKSGHQAPLAKMATKNRPANPAQEIGGPKGLEPTRFGDWEKNGRCSDF
ncbi:MAG: hypothetical protein ACI909_002331 [Planctomycetota bacterium]|jgi:hypothetical protein